MGVDGRFRHAKKFPHLRHRPLEGMKKHYHHTLPLRQLSQCASQLRFNPRQSLNIHRKQHRTAASDQPAPSIPANRVEVARRIIHLLYPIPMLPAVRKGLRRHLLAQISPKKCRQGMTKPRLGQLHELRERINKDVIRQIALPRALTLKKAPNTRSCDNQSGQPSPGYFVRGSASSEIQASL